ncbi:MAG TPA: hypothetical protein VF701_21290 [Thermoanaerobaculia bacterium]
MRIAIAIHILGGSAAIIAGYTALVATKGASLHRRAGMAFVWSMLVMTLTAAAVATILGQWGNLTGATLAAYLTVTGMATVRDRSAALHRIGIGAFIAAVAVGIGTFTLGLDALRRGQMAVDGAPVPMLFLFGSVALLAGASDIRIIRGAQLPGAARLRRHLWRVLFACFIATGSFFLGQADEIPRAIRFMPLLIVLAIFPLVSIPYWLWRVRTRRSRPATVLRATPDTA